VYRTGFERNLVAQVQHIAAALELDRESLLDLLLPRLLLRKARGSGGPSRDTELGGQVLPVAWLPVTTFLLSQHIAAPFVPDRSLRHPRFQAGAVLVALCRARQFKRTIQQQSNRAASEGHPCPPRNHTSVADFGSRHLLSISLAPDRLQDSHVNVSSAD